MISRRAKWLSLMLSLCLLALFACMLNAPAAVTEAVRHPQTTPTPDPVLVLRHETDLSAYDRMVVRKNSLTRSSAAALAGTSAGLAVRIVDSEPTYGQVSFAPLTDPTYRFRLYFDPNGLVMDEESVHSIVSLYDANETQKVWITLRRQEGDYRVRLNLRDDEYTIRQTDWDTIDDGEHWIEVLVVYASSETATDGLVSLWIDETQTQSITDLKLYNVDKPAMLRLGSNWERQGKSSGTYHLDEFVLRGDARRIGPVSRPATPTPPPENGSEIYLGHESGLHEYDSIVGGQGKLSQDPRAALGDTAAGLRVTVDDDTALYGTKTLGIRGGRAYRFRYHVDPNGLSMPPTAQITLAQVRGRRNLVVTRLQHTVTHGYTLYVRYVDDHGVWRSLPGTPISDAEHCVEVLVGFSSGASESDGSVTYWIDDVQAGKHENLDLYDKYRRPVHIRLGAPWVSQAAIRGTFYLDEFVLRKGSQYIGPAGTLPSRPTPTPSGPTPTAAPTATPTRTSPRGTPTPTGPQTIVVFPDAPRGPTIREVGGGNFHHGAQGVRDPVDPVGALNVKTLDPNYVRVNMALDDWEPTNDNRDPLSFNWNAFRESELHSAALALMQERASREATFVASIWDVPDWAVSNPESIHRRRIKPAMYPEVAESIVAWILWAQREYGVTIDYISINEPDIGVFVSMDARDYPPLIVETGKRLAEQGLEARWLLADVSNLRDCQEYAATVWNSPEARPYLGPLACHSYDQRFRSDQVLQDLARFAQSRGREFWVTEAQWRANLDPDLYPTWENALQLSIAYSRLLKEGQASTLIYWQMLKNGFSTNNGKRPYPALDMLAQFKSEIPARSQVVATSPNTGSLYSVAAQAPSHFALFAINASKQNMTVRIRDLPPGTYYQVVSSAGGTLQRAGQIQATEEITRLSLRPESVNVLTTQPPSN
jgi:O-glycosyl hydrolase